MYSLTYLGLQLMALSLPRIFQERETGDTSFIPHVEALLLLPIRIIHACHNTANNH
jgi:hypothetical protein